MSISRRDLILWAIFRAFAQETTFRSDVRLVTLLATVRDRNGALIDSLNKEDFIVEEDGVRQTIRYFSRISDLPLTVGLLVDTSKSEAWSIENERGASYTFLDKMLRENDRAFVAHFDFRVEVLQNLTSSRTLLASALDKLAIPKRSSTLLYRAVRECAEEQMRKQQGRKAFIVHSDGVDVHSKTTIATAIEFAQRADTIIYSILFNKWPAVADPGSAVLKEILVTRGKHAMRRLAMKHAVNTLRSRRTIPSRRSTPQSKKHSAINTASDTRLTGRLKEADIERFG